MGTARFETFLEAAMSLHINRFIDNIKAHESRNAREFMCPMRDAKDLHADITKLLLVVTDLQSRVQALQQESVITVEVAGRDF